MKHMKKLAGLLLALVMALSLATTAFAAQEGELTGGSITIDNAVKDQTYSIYQILYLESYDATSGAYAYKANSAWETWLKTQTSYVSIDTQGYVTWVAATDDATVAAFAKAAQAEATKEGSTITADGTVTASSTTVTFSDLKLGYYLVDSTLGTLCSLDTTNPSVTIKEKNVAPGNEKKVEEDSKTGTDGAWGSTNDADIGQTVNFQSTITAQAGAENYVFHDKMSAGLTYGSVTGITLNGTTVATSNYAVKTSELGDDCTFHVVFTQDFCDTLKANDKIVISYTATVNENAVVGGNGNKNESWLKYGENNDLTTTPSETTTYTWDVDVFKYTEGEADDEGKKTEVALSGATFTLSKNADGTSPISLVREKDSQGKDTNTYRVATANDTNTVTTITTDSTGKFTIKGLDSDTYYLTETAAPAGYNKLAGAITIVVGNDGSTTVDNVKVDEVKVLNQSGSELPSTGGMGTTIFYVVGSILLIGAAVLLITKKRMSAEK